jgi:hypothetical protein
VLVAAIRSLHGEPRADGWSAMNAIGYAIIEDGVIDVRTVAPTERAAKINWMLASKSIMTLDQARNADIEAVWLRVKGAAECMPVTITPRTN